MKKASFLLTVLFTLALTACVHKTLITPSQSRVGYSAGNTQVSYTHCDPLPKTGKPESVRGTWEVNDGILHHKASEEAPLAIRSGSIETGKWYNVKLTVAGDSIKAWLNSELMFDEVLK